MTREVLEVPADYKIASCRRRTPARVEMALVDCSARGPVTTIAWESSAKAGSADIVKELKLKDVTKLHAGYGEIPDLSKSIRLLTSSSPGTVTTSGRPRAPTRLDQRDPRRPHHLRRDLAAFAQASIGQLDVVTFSWQKALGAGPVTAWLLLSPRARRAAGKATRRLWPLRRSSA